MRISSAAVASITLATVLSSQAAAWGNKGHRIIAELTERRLAQKRPRILKEIRKLTSPGIRLATLSTCADDIRGYTSERSKGTENPIFPTTCLITAQEVETKFPRTAGWHFVNIPVPSDTRTSTADTILADACRLNFPCITTQIDHFRAQLANKKLANKDRAIALMFLTHLISDIHQPLHAVSRHEDQGGNKVFIKVGHDVLNLHSAWDTAFLENLEINTSFPSSLEASVRMNNRSAASWAWESYEIAASKVYKGILEHPSSLEDPIPVPEPGYRNEAVPEIQKRLYAASVRLADALIQALGKS